MVSVAVKQPPVNGNQVETRLKEVGSRTEGEEKASSRVTTADKKAAVKLISRCAFGIGDAAEILEDAQLLSTCM